VIILVYISKVNDCITLNYLQYKTERDGVVETRVERKITVTSDGDDDLDHDAVSFLPEFLNFNSFNLVYASSAWVQVRNMRKPENS
jgi:hypothetical protein